MPLDRLPDKTKNKADPNLGARTARIVFIPWDIVEGAADEACCAADTPKRAAR